MDLPTVPCKEGPSICAWLSWMKYQELTLKLDPKLKGHCHRDSYEFWLKLLKNLIRYLFANIKLFLEHREGNI